MSRYLFHLEEYNWHSSEQAWSRHKSMFLSIVLFSYLLHFAENKSIFIGPTIITSLVNISHHCCVHLFVPFRRQQVAIHQMSRDRIINQYPSAEFCPRTYFITVGTMRHLSDQRWSHDKSIFSRIVPFSDLFHFKYKKAILIGSTVITSQIDISEESSVYLFIAFHTQTIKIHDIYDEHSANEHFSA